MVGLSVGADVGLPVGIVDGGVVVTEVGVTVGGRVSSGDPLSGIGIVVVGHAVWTTYGYSVGMLCGEAVGI